MVSANHWERSIETSLFLWWLTEVSAGHTSSNSGLGPVSRKSRKLLGPENKTASRLFCEAGLFICCKGNKNLTNHCIVSFLETPLFCRYKENYVTPKAPENFRDFRETAGRTINIATCPTSCLRSVKLVCLVSSRSDPILYRSQWQIVQELRK